MHKNLSIKNLSCGYGGAPVLTDFSLDIRTGNVLCILGRNGIGKTTLFRSLLGSLHPLAGTVTIDTKDLFALERRERAGLIAYVPQSHDPPFAYMTFDIVLMGRAGLMSAFSAPSDRDRKLAAEALDLLGIGYLAQRAYTKISGGERQLILIARAIAQGADFLFLDEPAANLDIGNQMKVLRILRDLAAAGKGIIFTSHDPNHALLLGADVAAIRGPGEMDFGTAEEVITADLATQLYNVRAGIIDAEMIDAENGGSNVKVFAPFLD
jgi:iron complex transport system ATP-binding protein